MDINQIRTHALFVRRQVTKYARSIHWKRTRLGGMCALASFALKEYLNNAGIKEGVRVMGGWYYQESGRYRRDIDDLCWHNWVEVWDGEQWVVVDITATQFDVKDKVVISTNVLGPPDEPEPQYEDYENWPMAQRPHPSTISRILN